MARDWFQPGDIRPYQIDEQGPGGEQQELAEDRVVELEALDLVTLGPHLLLLHAREAAEALLTDARSSASEIREQSRSEGIDQGRAEGKEQLVPAVIAFANAGQALIVFEEQMIARHAPEIVRLALEIAEKIIGKSLLAEPEIIASVLERARREVVEARRIFVHINPEDYELLSEIRPDLLKTGNNAGRVVEIVRDENLGRGGCRLETEIGVVDATVATQLSELRRQLLDEESSANIGVEPVGSGLKGGNRHMNPFED
jgi:flagellar biosynthesis/type III secretory pathway protein FliH